MNDIIISGNLFVFQCGPVYNTMMISQPANANVVHIPSGLAPKISQGNAINRYGISLSLDLATWFKVGLGEISCDSYVRSELR